MKLLSSFTGTISNTIRELGFFHDDSNLWPFTVHFSPWCPQRANVAPRQELSRILGSEWLHQDLIGLVLSKIVRLVKFALGAFLPPLP